MTSNEIKTKLQKIYSCKVDFTVIQSDKKSLKVNGTYNPLKKEIVIHNKNFKNDNGMLFTAIHELTHHILITEKNIKNKKSHSGIFWSTFYDLIDIAVEKKIYSRTRSKDVKELVQSAKEIQQEIINAEKKLSKIIYKLEKACSENGDRFEDVVESDLQITRKKVHELCSVSTGNKYNSEILKAISQAKGLESEAEQMAKLGKTINQIKAITKKNVFDDDLENPEQLKREKIRLEKNIERLNDRLVQVEETLNSMLKDDK